MSERRRISLTTVVLGGVLLIIAGLVAFVTVTGMQIDPLLAAAVVLLLAGLTLILGAAVGGRRPSS